MEGRWMMGQRKRQGKDGDDAGKVWYKRWMCVRMGGVICEEASVYQRCGRSTTQAQAQDHRPGLLAAMRLSSSCRSEHVNQALVAATATAKNFKL